MPRRPLDASTSYDVTPHVQIFAEGLNLTDETYSTHGRYQEQLARCRRLRRRFTVGLRAHF